MTRLLDNPFRRWRMGNESSLGDVADLHKAYLSELERGELGPTLSRVKISRRLGAPVRDLFEVDSLEVSA
ncbi:MAG: helix-turn-helix transcriptional regulator [Ornithinimicrobium sp.]